MVLPACRYCRRKSAEAHHRGEHDVDIVAADKVADRLHTCKYLDIMGLQRVGNFLVSVFVAYDHIVRVKLYGLTYQQLCAVVGCKQFHFEQVPVQAYHIESLSSYGSGRSEYRYPSLLHLS